MKKNKAFTLVELIVVITILAILWTIAIVSFNGYSRDARNSKKTRELSSISRQIELERIKGADFLTYAANTGALITGTNIQIAWYDDDTSFPWTYVAWDLNFSALKLNASDFRDTVFDDIYKYGATSAWQRYQLAATIETASDLNSYIVWNWYARESSEVRWPREQIIDNVFYLSWAIATELGFYIGDEVRMTSSWTYTITDLIWNEIHLDTTITTPGSNIFLHRNETRHLIKKWDSNFAIDIDRWERYVPYK